jgi:hypothetical protein
VLDVNEADTIVLKNRLDIYFIFLQYMGHKSINRCEFHITTVVPVDNDFTLLVEYKNGRDCHLQTRQPARDFFVRFSAQLLTTSMSGRGKPRDKNRLGRTLQKAQKQKKGQVNESGELVLGYVTDKSGKTKTESILDQTGIARSFSFCHMIYFVDMQAVLEYTKKINVENQRAVCRC